LASAQKDKLIFRERFWRQIFPVYKTRHKFGGEIPKQGSYEPIASYFVGGALHQSAQKRETTSRIERHLIMGSATLKNSCASRFKKIRTG